ncbi:unnamed protein product [Penicillium bialowiezense]
MEPALEPRPKRRKVRKGTSSCWDCKNRKKRCEFESDSKSGCVSCRRRGIPCISQASAHTADDEHNGYEGVSQHIDRVEDLVRQLVHQRGARSQERNHRQVVSRPVFFNASRHSTLKSISHERMSRSSSLTGYLNSVLPAPHIAAIIFNSNKQYNAPLQILQGLRLDEESAERQGMPKSDIFPTMHPVSFARRLIKLALCLQELDEKGSEQLCSDLGESTLSIARRWFQVATGHVMTQDYLVSSLDGLETLLLQSRYHISLGELEHAWQIYKRAFHIAYLVDIPTQAQVRGQPVATTHDTALPQSPTHHPAQELERVHVTIAKRIIARNIQIQNTHHAEAREASQWSYRETKSLDLQLKKAARAMPTAWWKPPVFAAKELDQEVIEKTAKLLVQTHQYYLLVVLHQPYIIGNPSRDQWKYGLSPIEYTYSTTAVVAASREVLTRYLVLRHFHRSSSYRGFDEKAFTASLALLFAHLNGHSLGSSNVLEHQRPHDLGILEDVICCMEKVSSLNRDLQGCARAEILKQLAKIEVNAADGCDYEVYSAGTLAQINGTEPVGIKSDLEVSLPYLGHIHVARQITPTSCVNVSTTSRPASIQRQDQFTPQTTLGAFHIDNPGDESDSGWLDEWTIQENWNLD